MGIKMSVSFASILTAAVQTEIINRSDIKSLTVIGKIYR